MNAVEIKKISTGWALKIEFERIPWLQHAKRINL